MSTQTWFITGASSGLGASVANAAFAPATVSLLPRGTKFVSRS